jgi:Fibronectin type III domain
MTYASASHYEQVADQARHRILIEQTAMNQHDNTSTVRVRGMMYNDTDEPVYSLHQDMARSISGDGSYTPGNTWFYVEPTEWGEPWGYDYSPFTYIDHSFVVSHNSAGFATAAYTVTYGETNSIFGDWRSCSASLSLARVPRRPSPPGMPAFSNVTPTSVTVSWAPPSDNGGSTITSYRLRRYTGGSPVGPYTDSTSSGLSRNVTGLSPGTNYCFTVYAKNSAHDNDGWSDASLDSNIQQLGGTWIRNGGKWYRAVAYVRYQGEWRMAQPFVRSGGTWHQTD